MVRVMLSVILLLHFVSALILGSVLRHHFYGSDWLSLAIETTDQVIMAHDLIMPCAASDLIENPQYRTWARYKPGTTIVWKRILTTGGMTVEQKETMTLKEVNAEKVVVESKLLSLVNDTLVPQQTETIIHSARIPLSTSSEISIRKVGEETLTINGTKFVTTIKLSEFLIRGEKNSAKNWVNDEFPGGTLKTVGRSEGSAPMDMESRVVDFTLVR